MKIKVWWRLALVGTILGAANYGRYPTTDRFVFLLMGVVYLLVTQPVERSGES